jgi:hypothetical protein
VSEGFEVANLAQLKRDLMKMHKLLMVSLLVVLSVAVLLTAQGCGKAAAAPASTFYGAGS